MAKVNSPILSIGARGTVGKTQVYSSWRGIPYARKWVQPANPKSTGQTQTRSVFAFMSNLWKVAPSLMQDPWQAFAKGQALTGRNAAIGQNTKAMRTGTDLSAIIVSPGANGGLPPANVVATPGSGQIGFALTNPSPPTGWTLSGATAWAIKDGDPHLTTSYVSKALAATTPFTSVTLTGLTAGANRWAVWLKWTKPDGSTAYSTSTTGVATVT